MQLDRIANGISRHLRDGSITLDEAKLLEEAAKRESDGQCPYIDNAANVLEEGSLQEVGSLLQAMNFIETLMTSHNPGRRR